MGKVISIINMKGGVGKTTLSIGIADYLSNIKKNILLIDADPQFNATQALLDAYKSQNKDSENENFYNRVVLPKKKTIHRLFRIQEDMYSSLTMPTDNDLIIELKQNLSILCGDLSLVLVNRSSDHTFVTRLRNFIEDNNIKQKYDYIIIDIGKERRSDDKKHDRFRTQRIYRRQEEHNRRDQVCKSQIFRHIGQDAAPV